MVLSAVTVEYKVERVLVNQVSSANVLYWTTFQKLGLIKSELEEYPSTLIGFSSEQIEIYGTKSPKFKKWPKYQNNSREVACHSVNGPPMYDVPNQRLSGGCMCRPACSQTMLQRQFEEYLKEVQIGLNLHHRTKIEGSLNMKTEERLIQSVCQKKRRLGGEKRRTIKEETTKLLQAQFVLEDPHPLPSIDGLVDGESRCGLLSFMDAYSGYNQIRMHPSGKSKMTFITNEGNFCYRVMSFGLRNAGATRLMGRIFKNHIDC
ncbi:hypothetical protein CR513_54198, partial [Mucuna pruriens]